MKHLRTYNESLRDQMVGKSDEELEAIRQRALKHYGYRKEQVIKEMTDVVNKLGVKIQIIEQPITDDFKGHCYVEFVYNDITYHMTINPFENEFQAGYSNKERIGDWEDVKYIEDGIDHINQWVAENEWKRKNKIDDVLAGISSRVENEN